MSPAQVVRAIPGHAAPAATPANPGTEQMRRVAAEFESVFLAQMLKDVTPDLAGPGEGDGSQNPFASMLQDEYAKLMSRNGGIGLADAILRDMLKAREAA